MPSGGRRRSSTQWAIRRGATRCERAWEPRRRRVGARCTSAGSKQQHEIGGARMTARSLLFIVQIAAALFSLAAATPAPAAEPIRIGFMAPLSGLFAQAGKDMLDGLRLGLEEAGFQAGGRRIELITEDDEGNNSTAVAKYRKLVEHDRVHVFTGVL